MDVAASDKSLAVISARSRRQVMDWSLVLASQSIPSTIIQSDETGWGLQVDSLELDRAREAIRQYRLENRRWVWHQPIPWTDAAFHWGSLAWCFLLIFVHGLTALSFPQFRDAAQFDTRVVAHGEWWRAFSAILLHADLAHLLFNATSGFLLLGLAMARYGAGVALLGSYLAGAAGNLAGFLIYPHPYVGLGASGMVMGALGLLSIPPRQVWSLHPRALKQLTQVAFASIMLFVLLGVDPSSDVVAHLGGFLAAIIIGLGLTLLPSRTIQSKRIAGLAWIIAFALFALTTCLALSKVPRL